MIDIPSSKPIYILLIFLCSAFACQQSSDQPASIHTADLQQLEPKLEFVISDSDEVLLLQVNAVTSDMNGNIYVPDQSAMQIHVFNSNGEFITSLGRQGSGPGEFQSIYGVIVDINGQLFVNDIPQLRITVFAVEDGDWEVRHIISNEGGNRYAVESAGSGGELIFRQSPPQSPEPGLFWYKHELSTGTVEEGVIESDVLRFRAESVLVKEDLMMQLMPFSRTTVVSRAPDGAVYLVWNDRFELAVYDPDLNLTDSLTVAIPNQPIDRDERREILDEGFLSEFRSLGQQYLSETKPVIENMYVDSNGNIWLHTYDSPEYMVIDEGGNPVGSFDLPEELTLVHVDAGRLYALKSDDLGYEIHVFNIAL